MNNQLVQNTAEQAVVSILVLNKRILDLINNNLSQLDRVLTKTMGDNKTLLTADQIVAASGGKLDQQQAFIAALKAAVNVAVPGTYPA